MVTPENQPGRLDQFSLELEHFSGPLDLLLSLITRKRLDITEIALAEVTDEFLDYMRRYPDLSQTSEFLVIAATLLDIKATRLLPNAEIEAEDAEYLEARDLLFARLLQYRAFKEAAAALESSWERESRLVPRSVELEDHFKALVPELSIETTPDQLARIAALAFSGAKPHVEVTHLHDPVVPVAGQIHVLIETLHDRGVQTFSELIADAPRRAVVISRFLALLELYRARMVTFSQDEALGTLTVTYTPKGDDVGPVNWSLMSEEVTREHA